MVTSSDKRLLWHPRGENKFVVGSSSQITLYEWRPEALEIRHTTSQHDLQYMKCFAWSPDPSFDDLIAVGLTGRVDLMRLEATKHTRDGVLSSGPSASLPVRSSRACNALSFNHADPNYLAVGLEKVRGDCSLVIWDVSSLKPSLSFTNATVYGAGNGGLEPTRPQPLIQRGDLGPKTDGKILQMHAPTEIVSSLAFAPDAHYLLWAGISHRWLRLFDVRSPVPSTTNVATKVQGIATDPFVPSRIATFDDGVVSIWDYRRLPQPLLTFSEHDAYGDGAKPYLNPSTFTTIEFSSVRRGTIATLEKDSAHVRFWDLQEAQFREVANERSRDSSAGGRTSGGRLNWPNPSSMLPWTTSSTGNIQVKEGRRDRDPSPSTRTPPTILVDTRKTKDFPASLTSFALVPERSNGPLSSNLVVVNKEGDLEVNCVYNPPSNCSWSHRGDLSIALGTSYRIFSTPKHAGPSPNPWQVPLLHKQSREASTGSKEQTEDDDQSRNRGRSQSLVFPPTFGRGDEDGFPALNATLLKSALDANRAQGNAVDGIFIPPSLSRRSAAVTRAPSLRDLRAAAKEPSQTGTPVQSTTADKLADLDLGLEKDPQFVRPSETKRSSQQSAHQKLRQVLQRDVSTIMRWRAIKGYGLANLAHNHVLTSEDSMLSETWLWLNYSREILEPSKPKSSSYDLMGQGVLGIWEGGIPSFAPRRPVEPIPASPMVAVKSIADHVKSVSGDGRSSSKSRDFVPPSRRGSRLLLDTNPLSTSSATPEDDYVAALNALCLKAGDTGVRWKPGTPTSKTAQRRMCLQLVGWCLREDELNHAISKWEFEDKHSQAACWLVFMGQYQRAVKMLMNSKDESNYLICGTIAALTYNGPGLNTNLSNPDLREHCARLVVHLQDPYLRAMITHLTVNDWTDVLEEDSFPIRERLAVAFQFLDDKSLPSFLRSIVDQSIQRGDLTGLIVTGLTAQGMEILQRYVDLTGDVQTAAVICSLRVPSLITHNGKTLTKSVADRWVETYQDLLDGWKLFHHRCQFDIERGRLIQEALGGGDGQRKEWQPRRVMIRCNLCNKTIDTAGSKGKGSNVCPNCGKALPRCSICLMTLNVASDPARDAYLLHTGPKDTIAEAIVFCQTCRHGGHASHIMEWFFGDDPTGFEGDENDQERGGKAHSVCPVPDCDCPCADEM